MRLPKALQTKAIRTKALLFAALIGGAALLPAAPAQAQNFGVSVQFGHPAYGYGYGYPPFAYNRYAWQRHEAWVRHQEWINAHRFYGRPGFGYGGWYGRR